MRKKSNNTLVRNASFLMVAALISKIIGMLYKGPLSTTIGSNSYALFQYAQNAYFILLMIASFSIPQAVSKIMAEKIAFKKYKDAQRVFRCSLLYAAVAGGVVALFCVFGTRILVPETMAGSRLALQMLAPTIFLSGILGVFRGYFQAYRNMMPTSISQIVEQIFVATFAILISGIMVQTYKGQGGILDKWAAAGATMGTGVGVSAALIFMVFIYSINYRRIRKNIIMDKSKNLQPYGEVMKTIIIIVMPIILSAFIYNVNAFINSYMYSSIMGFRGMNKNLLQVNYAEYGYFMTLINIPLTLASTAPTSMIPEVSAHYARNDIKMANSKTVSATWISMIISIPAAFGLCVLAGPITRLIFPDTNNVAAELLILGGITVILNGNSNISNGVLQGIGKPHIPMYNAAIALVADVILMAILLFTNNLGVYNIVIAMIFYSIIMCVLNDMAMKKYMNFKNPWKEAYLPPLLASIPMVIVAGVVYYGLYFIIRRNLICLLPAVILAAFAYLFSYIAIKQPSKEEIYELPMGVRIYKLVRKFGIIK